MLSDLIYQIVQPSAIATGDFEEIIVYVMTYFTFSTMRSMVLFIFAGSDALSRNGFDGVESDKKCQVVELLGRAPCAADGTLIIGRAEPGAHPKMSCSFCSGQKGKGRLPPESTNKKAKAEAYAAFARLVELPTFQQATRPRVMGMMALRRFALHSIEPEFLNIQTSPLASWSVRSLKSSIRELRIAAGYVESACSCKILSLELPC